MKLLKRKLILTLALICAFQIVSFSWSPAGDKIKTRWAKDVTPDNVWKSYPRPQLKRSAWTNLNGLWNYSVTGQNTQKSDVVFDGEILVPFAIESSLSGVAKSFEPTDKLWYQKKFEIDPTWSGKNIILHFGAVDYSCSVWVNNKLVGSHIGGNNRFSFDITKFLNKKGVQILELAVTDPTDTESNARGKQQLNAKGIMYTPVSGIWQTVWLEPISKSHIERVLPTSDVDNMMVALDIEFGGVKGDEKICIEVLKGDKVIKSLTKRVSEDIEFSMVGQELWSPENPRLYELKLSLYDGVKELDKVSSYFAMRKVDMQKDEKGYNRVFLNNKPIFQYGTLDQGWWPDGLLTPPTEEAMMWDMVQLKALGFNTIRKHIKVEPELYYYYADSLGLMLWQDMVSGFSTKRKAEEFVRPEHENDWNAPDSHAKQWNYEFYAMIDNLKFYPSITTWVVFNEGWGQFNTEEIVNKIIDYDKTRVVNGVSGWKDRKVSHYYDIHNYPATSMILPQYNDDRISVLGEFGGFGWAIDDHIWNPQMYNWGYKNIDGSIALTENYASVLYDLESLIAQGLAAAIYTQTTDIEGEVNGLITYDREIVKIPTKLIHILQSRLYEVESADVVTLINDNQGGEKHIRKVSIDGKAMEDKELPLAFESKTDVASQTTFYADKEFKHLSLWTNITGDVKVWLNGTLIMDQNITQQRHYNQYNLSNWAQYLKKGENIFKIQTIGGEKFNLDYGLRAY